MDKKKIGTVIREKIGYYTGEIWQTSYHFVKWNVLAIFTGVVIGVISSAFGMRYPQLPVGETSIRGCCLDFH